MKSYLYDIPNNKIYRVGPAFPFITLNRQLSKQTPIVDCEDINELRLDNSNDDIINDDLSEATVIAEESVQEISQNHDQDD
jgi:hypothetical protein